MLHEKYSKSTKLRFLSIDTIIFITCLTSILVSSIIMNTDAKYTATVSSKENQGEVAKFGDLKLEEYTANDNILIDNSGINTNENVKVVDGENINKNLKISYSAGEVSTYTFFVVEAKDWTYTENTKTLSVKGTNNVDLIYFNINDNWTYLSTEKLDSSERYIFYHLIEQGTVFEDTTLEKINVNPISIEDKNILNNDHSINFSAYVIQKSGMDNIEMAWNYVKGEI